jgi:hypothetical protein
MRRSGSTQEMQRIAEVEELEDALDALRQSLARADAMVCATEHQLERFTWGIEDDGDDSAGDDEPRRRLDHLAHLLGAAKEAVRAAVDAGSNVAARLVERRRCK